MELEQTLAILKPRYLMALDEAEDRWLVIDTYEHVVVCEASSRVWVEAHTRCATLNRLDREEEA